VGLADRICRSSKEVGGVCPRRYRIGLNGTDDVVSGGKEAEREATAAREEIKHAWPTTRSDLLQLAPNYVTSLHSCCYPVRWDVWRARIEVEHALRRYARQSALMLRRSRTPPLGTACVCWSRIPVSAGAVALG
jgi:hypothetical protein